jgi:hypothetical protein
MSNMIAGVVKNGVVVPKTPLPEGACVEIHLLTIDESNPLLHFPGHLDPKDPLEQEFVQELTRRRRDDAEQSLREDDQECFNSSSTPTT